MDISEVNKKNAVLFFICVALIFGIVGFYVGQNVIPLPKRTDATITTKTDIQKTTTQQPTGRGESVGLKFFYGYVIEKKDTKLLVQEVLLTGLYGASMYLVHTDDKTQYETFAVVDIKKNGGQTKQKGKKGSFADIKPEMYVFVATKDRLVSTPSIYAASISYSQASPFPLQPVEKK